MPPPRVLRSILELSELLQELRNTDATTGMQRRTDLAARGVNVGASAVNSANAFIRRAEGKGKATGGPRGGFVGAAGMLTTAAGSRAKPPAPADDTTQRLENVMIMLRDFFNKRPTSTVIGVFRSQASSSSSSSPSFATHTLLPPPPLPRPPPPPPHRPPPARTPPLLAGLRPLGQVPARGVHCRAQAAQPAADRRRLCDRLPLLRLRRLGRNRAQRVPQRAARRALGQHVDARRHRPAEGLSAGARQDPRRQGHPARGHLVHARVHHRALAAAGGARAPVYRAGQAHVPQRTRGAARPGGGAGPVGGEDSGDAARLLQQTTQLGVARRLPRAGSFGHAPPPQSSPRASRSSP